MKKKAIVLVVAAEAGTPDLCVPQIDVHERSTERDCLVDVVLESKG
jgi:hypothetical protein